MLINGCSSNNNSTKSTTKLNLKYSNINDETTQNEISKMLSENNIGKNNIDMFMKSIQSYYKNIEGVEILNDSEKLSDLQVPYNIYELSDKWLEKNLDYSDQNCRLTAFRLFNNFIISESNLSYNQMDTNNLELDLNALKYNPNAKFSDADMNKFVNFFSNISVKDSNNIKQSAEEISSELGKRKILFKSNDSISIINGYVLDEENKYVFVGHTGAAISNNDGIIFIEKYGFELPYQITLFKNKEDLKLYMYDRLKISFTGEKQSYEP